MNLEDLFDREAIIEGIARGMAQFLAQTDAARQFGDLVELLGDLHLLKEGVLDSDQAAKFLGIARRTFDRKVQEKLFRKKTVLGRAQPRHILVEMMEDLLRPPGQVLSAVTGEPGPAFSVVQLPGQSAERPRRGRGRPRNNQKPAA